jgi:hypothetical protein
MPIPAVIETEDGRKPTAPRWLRQRFAEARCPDASVPSPTEMAGMLGVVGSGWSELLKAGFPQPCSVAQAKAWFQERGWLDE